MQVSPAVHRFAPWSAAVCRHWQIDNPLLHEAVARGAALYDRRRHLRLLVGPQADAVARPADARRLLRRQLRRRLRRSLCNGPGQLAGGADALAIIALDPSRFVGLLAALAAETAADHRPPQ